jgi:alpha-ketoglutaric semialdehyde dehydrogenase
MSGLTGNMLIGASAVYGNGGVHHATNPANGALLEPAYGMGSQADVERACALAWETFDRYRETTPERRSEFLQTCASEIETLGDVLIERAMLETGLPRARLEGERARTTGQLRLFADVVWEGSRLEARIDPALPARTPMPRSGAGRSEGQPATVRIARGTGGTRRVCNSGIQWHAAWRREQREST